MDVDGWRKEASINGLAVSRILGSPHSLAPAPKTSTPEAGSRNHYMIIGQFRQWCVLVKAWTFPSETCVQILSQLGDVRWTNFFSSFSLPIWKMTIMTIPVMVSPSSSRKCCANLDISCNWLEAQKMPYRISSFLYLPMSFSLRNPD